MNRPDAIRSSNATEPEQVVWHDYGVGTEYVQIHPEEQLAVDRLGRLSDSLSATAPSEET
jgi:hypothetical protein